MKIVACKICSEAAQTLGTFKVLGKYSVEYFRCQSCNFVQTEDPYWLRDAYAAALSKNDVGLVWRNLHYAKITRSLLSTLIGSSGSFLDYGGGSGLFVRLMRDRGLDFYWSDKYAENLLAKGFSSSDRNKDQYACVTAFEVFEHLADPINEVEQILRFSKNIIFTTALVPSNNPGPEHWWYYGLEHGQHIALYSKKTLEVMANKLGLNLYSNNSSLHFLTDKQIPASAFRFVSRYKVATILDLLIRRKPLLEEDYQHITQQTSNNVAIDS